MIKLNMESRLSLEQRLDAPHHAMSNPDLTLYVEDTPRCPSESSVVSTERTLLELWKHVNETSWEDYIDTPLIAHGDAALRLKDSAGYDAVVGIKEGGVPYARFFGIFGIFQTEIDFSHRKRSMTEPIIEQEQIASLQGCNKVLLTDVDFVTGKTLRVVTDYLRERNVNVAGAYIGLTSWPGTGSEDFAIGSDSVDFDRFWKCRTNGLSHLRSTMPYRKGILPPDLQVYAANRWFESNKWIMSPVASNVKRYLKSLRPESLRTQNV